MTVTSNGSYSAVRARFRLLGIPHGELSHLVDRCRAAHLRRLNTCAHLHRVSRGAVRRVHSSNCAKRIKTDQGGSSGFFRSATRDLLNPPQLFLSALRGRCCFFYINNARITSRARWLLDAEVFLEEGDRPGPTVFCRSEVRSLFSRNVCFRTRGWRRTIATGRRAQSRHPAHAGIRGSRLDNSSP